MRKLKRLTRKSLDELAKVMPTISELRQQEYVGGDYYYNANGELLFSTPGGEIYISRETNYDKEDRPDYSYLKSNLTQAAREKAEGNAFVSEYEYRRKYCTGFIHTSGSIQTKIIKKIANDLGFRGEVRVRGYSGSNDTNGTNGGYNTGNHVISIYNTSDMFLRGDYYEFQSTLVHEMDHAKIIPSGTRFSDDDREIFDLSANWAQLNHSSFKNLSTSSKRSKVSRYKKLYNKVKSSNPEKLNSSIHGNGQWN